MKITYSVKQHRHFVNAVRFGNSLLDFKSDVDYHKYAYYDGEILTFTNGISLLTIGLTPPIPHEGFLEVIVANRHKCVMSPVVTESTFPSFTGTDVADLKIHYAITEVNDLWDFVTQSRNRYSLEILIRAVKSGLFDSIFETGGRLTPCIIVGMAVKYYVMCYDTFE